MNKDRKIKLLEKLILNNSCIWFDNKTLFSKWDDQINWLEGFPKEFKRYIIRLHKKGEVSK